MTHESLINCYNIKVSPLWKSKGDRNVQNEDIDPTKDFHFNYPMAYRNPFKLSLQKFSTENYKYIISLQKYSAKFYN